MKKIRKILIYIFAILYIPSNLYAEQGESNYLELSQEAIEITEELRCLVCESQNVLESNSNFSKDIKLFIHNELNNNKTKDQIINQIHSKYGDSVLLRPPLQKNTILLWFSPLIIFSLILFYIIRRIRRGLF
tara:strand:- start:10172 stop:10567 length:396 start_codon:yes stop_codon:yes gene_type:complete